MTPNLRRHLTPRRLAVAFIVIVVALVLFSQQAAAGMGALIGGLWVGAMDVVLRLIGALFGQGG